VRTTHFWKNIPYKIGKPNKFKVFSSVKTKGQDSQNRLRSPKPEGSTRI